LGYFVGLLGSGFVSCRLTHRKMIVLSSMAVGGALLAVSISNSLWWIRLGLIPLGLAAGFYLPSGIAAITAMVSSRDWGKAIAIHEMAPNLGFVTAPLLAEGLMIWFSWREVIALLGVVAVLASMAFKRFGRGGEFPGEAPNTQTIQVLVAQPSFWIMIVFFSLGMGASLGIYNMLPLYLVAERGLERSYANTLVALSRIAGPGIALLAGWITDQLGVKRTLGGVFIATGMVTILLGTVKGLWLVPILFLQPMLALCFFPGGFVALSSIGPPQVRNVTVSITAPAGFFLGGGAIPAGIGVMAEAGFFSLGIIAVGVLLIVSIILLRYLAFHAAIMK
jgi:NNP family nitrate/nitrite transporter-like MFS transporter